MRQTGLYGRRDVLRGLMLGGLAFVTARPAAGQAATAAKPAKPPRTCGAWTDPAGNGRCDRSEKSGQRCGAVRCPGHRDNAARRAFREAGAPEGVCALWSDPGKNGYCGGSESKELACAYVACPAHRDRAGNSKRPPVGIPPGGTGVGE
jgi:hypothetical protein